MHGDLQRSGYYPHFPEGPLRLAWRKELYRELTGPRCEVIVGGGLAYLGTYAGRLYAWDDATGQERWRFQAGGAIGHSPAWDGGTLYAGSLDHQLYALDAGTGKLRWSYKADEGIWTSPAVSGGRVIFGARDGVLYALDARTGKLAWRHQTSGPILSTAAVTEDGTRVLFASEDMHLYCLDTRSGKPLWRSTKLQGLSTRDYFPVLHRGLAFITTNPATDFHTVLDRGQKLLLDRTGYRGADPRYTPGTPEDVRREQDAIVDYLKGHPEDRTFYAFDLRDGHEPWLAPVLYTGGLHNPLTPPCVNRKTGEVFLQVRSAYGVWDGGGEVRPYTHVGRLNLVSGRIELLVHGHRSSDPSRPAGRKDMPFAAFNTIGDETQTLSCSPEYLFSNHQGTLGSLNFRSGLTEVKWGKRDTYGGFYGPGTFGWEDQGGMEKARRAGQPFGLVNEWHGPARGIASVAGDRVYYTTGSQVLCLEARP